MNRKIDRDGWMHTWWYPHANFFAKAIRYTYTTSLIALPDTCVAWVCVHIYQTKYECQWYKCYVLNCLCRLIACLRWQTIRVGTLDFFYRQLKEIWLWASTCKLQPRYYYICKQKQANPKEFWRALISN